MTLRRKYWWLPPEPILSLIIMCCMFTIQASLKTSNSPFQSWIHYLLSPTWSHIISLFCTSRVTCSKRTSFLPSASIYIWGWPMRDPSRRAEGKPVNGLRTVYSSSPPFPSCHAATGWLCFPVPWLRSELLSGCLLHPALSLGFQELLPLSLGLTTAFLPLSRCY